MVNCKYMYFEQLVNEYVSCIVLSLYLRYHYKKGIY